MTDHSTYSNLLFENLDFPENYSAPVIVGVYIKTPENIGNIIRLADNLGCNDFFFVTEENYRNSRIKKTASSSYKSIHWKFIKESELDSLIPKNYNWIAVETAANSKNLYSYKFPSKVAFFVGNEINGINSGILNKCDEIIHIPVLGKNKSLNVSHALAVVLFEWQKQILSYS